MFGKLLGKNNDMAEKLAGVDLDGDGKIGGVPIQKPAAAAPAPAAKTAPQQAPQQAVKPAASINASSLLDAGKAFLSNSGRLKPQAGAGVGGMLNMFKNFSPEVQQHANKVTRDLDDGSTMPLSSLNGRRKALLIGINYYGTPNELKGCINDVKNVKNLITTKFGFSADPNSMLVLTDDQTDPSRLPTRENILRGMKWLEQGAQSGDSLFIHYSGHGAYKKDTSPDSDEADGQDETLVPMDYATAGMIVDDEIFDVMVAPLPKGVRLTALMDCCHSGSVFDLPYSYVLENGRDIPTEIDHRALAIAAAMAAGKALLAKDYGGVFKNLLAAGQNYVAMNPQGGAGGGGAGGLAGMLAGAGGAQQQQPASQPAPVANTSAPVSQSVPVSNNNNNYNTAPPAAAAPVPSGPKLGSVVDSQNVSATAITIRTTVCDCVQFSGCRDEQTSADAFIGGESTGAMSYALIKAFNDNGVNQTYSQLLKNIREILYGKYKQIPQMSTGHRFMNLDGPFLM